MDAAATLSVERPRRGTQVGQPTLRCATMDDKSLNLWRQIEGARRVGKRQAMSRPRPQSAPQRG